MNESEKHSVFDIGADLYCAALQGLTVAQGIGSSGVGEQWGDFRLVLGCHSGTSMGTGVAGEGKVKVDVNAQVKMRVMLKSSFKGLLVMQHQVPDCLCRSPYPCVQMGGLTIAVIALLVTVCLAVVGLFIFKQQHVRPMFVPLSTAPDLDAAFDGERA